MNLNPAQGKFAGKRIFSISEASEYLGVSVKTLLRWEEKTGFKPPKTSGGHRRYTKSQLELLQKAAAGELPPTTGGAFTTHFSHPTPPPTSHITSASSLFFAGFSLQLKGAAIFGVRILASLSNLLAAVKRKSLNIIRTTFGILSGLYNYFATVIPNLFYLSLRPLRALSYAAESSLCTTKRAIIFSLHQARTATQISYKLLYKVILTYGPVISHSLRLGFSLPGRVYHHTGRALRLAHATAQAGAIALGAKLSTGHAHVRKSVSSSLHFPISIFQSITSYANRSAIASALPKFSIPNWKLTGNWRLATGNYATRFAFLLVAAFILSSLGIVVSEYMPVSVPRPSFKLPELSLKLPFVSKESKFNLESEKQVKLEEEPITSNAVTNNLQAQLDELAAVIADFSLHKHTFEKIKLTSTYFSSLDGSKLSSLNADKLDEFDSGDLLKSNQSDTAEGAINFTAKPGGSGVGGGPVYINPGSATAGYTLLGIAVNGTQYFKVDAEGDVFIEGDLEFIGAQTIKTNSGNLTIDSAGTFVVSDAASFSSGLTLSSGTLSLPNDSVTDAYVADDITLTSTKRITTTLITEQLRLAYDVSNYLSATVGSTGAVTLDATGAGAAFTISDALTASSTLTVSGASITASSASLALGGAVSGATTITGSGNINTTGGALQTNSVTRIDNSGNATLGTISASGDITWTATTPNIQITDAESITITDGTNTLLTLADAGTTGNLTISGNLTVSGTSVTLPNGSVGNSELGSDVGPRANLLVNGGFEIWQRGAGGFSADNVYSADRWRTYINGNADVTVTREATTIDNSQYSAKVDIVSDVTGSRDFVQEIEDYWQLQGKTITFSIRVNTSNAGASPFIREGGLAGATTTTGTAHTNGGGWETLTVTRTLSSTLSANVVVGLAGGNTGHLYYADNAMLVIGSQAVDYQPLPPADDLARAQRYYEVIGGAGGSDVGVYGYSDISGGQITNRFSFAVAKGGTPTCTKNGTWALTNTPSGRPIVQNEGASGFSLWADASGAGNFSAVTNSTDDTITCEWNP